MDINKKDDTLSKLFKKEFLQTMPKERNISSPLEINVKEKHLLTAQDLDNRKKLLDFISDKKKLCLKSVFDHKGTKSFLSEKEVAMKRIELNENLEGINLNEIEDKSIKKERHRRSADYLLDNNDIIIKHESIKKKKINKKHKSITTKIYGTKLNNIKDKFKDFELEQLLWEPKSPVNRKRKKLKENKNANNNLINLMKLDKSIISIETIDSKNSNKECDNSKNNVNRDDDPLIREILNELNVNKK